MIPGDLTSELARLLAAQTAAGALPPAAATLTANGTWRQPRAAAAAGPGSYSTSLPLELASLAQRPPGAIAAQLAEQLARLPWISIAHATDNYLTVTVTRSHLGGLPARILSAGPASAQSDALIGRALTAPHPPDLATTSSWTQAWRSQHAALVGRFGQAAGAQVHFFQAERNAVAKSPPKTNVGAPSAAVAYFGVDAVRFALAAAAGPRPAAIGRQLTQPLDLTNPFVMVRYAHADAASTLRWAADLGLAPDGHVPKASPAMVAAVLDPVECKLIDAMSWLPERVAAAHRSHRPAGLVAYLEDLARAWLDCSEPCSALPFRGLAAATDQVTTAARLELAEAASTTLAAGLGLLGIAAPAMM